MVELVLHDTCQIAFNPFVLIIEIGVHVLHMNTSWTCHALVYAWQREASLLHCFLWRLLVILQNMRIDESLLKTLILR